MHRSLRLLPVLAIIGLLFSSCHRVAKHARFIPKDAFMVLGVHTSEMRKELAWSAITGSNLLDELRKGGNDKVPEALKDLESSGLDFGSTLYFYTKPDMRFANGMRMAAVLPVADGKELNAYMAKHFPGVVIHSNGGRSEIFLDRKIYVSWNDEVLMAISPLVRKVEHNEAAHVDTLGGSPYMNEPLSWTEELPDSTATAVEMAAAFQPAKSSGIDELGRFTELEKAGHDITLWTSYDAMAELANGQGNARALGGMLGTSLTNTLFKGSAMAAGFDFEKGRVDGLMRYYSSDSMKPVAKEFARENIDGDMLRRLPAPGLNMAAGFHLSPAAIKLMLEKTKLSGMANLALMSQGLTIEDVLGGFTGDMVVAVNNFRMEQKMQEMDSAMQQEYGMTPYSYSKPTSDFVFALKIGDKTKLNKLLNLAGATNMLQQTAPNTYSLPGGAGGSLVIGDKYIAVSSNAAEAQAFLRDHAGAMPDAVHKEISGHPVGMWADIQSFVKGGGTLAGGSSSDSAAMAVVRNAFTTFSMKGGEIKDGANEYRMSLGFVNKGESSLVQLLHIAQQLSALNHSKKDEVTMR